MKRTRTLITLMTCLLSLALLTGCGGKKTTASSAQGDGAEPAAPTENAAPAEQEAENVGRYIAEITVENYGVITAELDGAAAPRTVENFVKLAEEGFYDGLTFHRIMDGFMIQGGDPQGTGFGGSDETIPGEFDANGWANPLHHVRGTLSMARSQNPNSASSQFFIVQSDSTFLDGNYAAFGTVTEGMEAVDQICADAVPLDNNGTIAREEQPVITSITVRPAE